MDSIETAVFNRHRGPVTCAAVVPGRAGSAETIVSSGYDGAVAITELGRRRMELMGYHEHLVNRIAVSADGRLAASPSADYTIGLWDLEQRRLVRFLRGHSDDVNDFVFVSPTIGVSVGCDRRVIVWDLTTGSITTALVGHEKDVDAVAYAQGKIFSTGTDMTLRVWDLDSGQLTRCWGPFEHDTDSCAVDPRRDRVVLGCDDGFVRIFEISSGRTIKEIPAHTSGVKVVAVAPLTGHIFSAAYDRRMLVWDVDTLEVRRSLEPFAAVWERSFNWAPDESRIVAGTFDGTIVGWDAASGRRLFEVGEHGGNACMNDVAAVDDLVVAAADDGYVRLGCIGTTASRWIAKREPEGGRVLANAVTVDQRAGVVAAGFHDQTLRVFRLAPRLEQLLSIDLRQGPINAVQVLNLEDEHQLMVACYNGCVVRVSSSGEVLSTFQIHDGAVKALRLLPEQGLGVSCSSDGSAFSWSLDSGERHMAFPAHTTIVNDVDIDAEGHRLVTVGRDFLLNVYTLSDGRLQQAFPLSRRSPKAVTFAGDDAVIVGDYWGHLLRVPLAGGEMSRCRVASNGISSLVQRDREHVLASSYEGAILLVNSSTLDVVRELRAMRQRPQRTRV